MNSALSLLLFLVLTSSTLAQGQLPRIVDVPCSSFLDEQLLSQAEHIQCSELHVLEDRNAPDGNIIRLFVVWVAARNDHDSAPLLYLAGGPGDAASSEVAWWLNTDLHYYHDIIFVDQRGSGRSEPSL